MVHIFVRVLKCLFQAAQVEKFSKLYQSCSGFYCQPGGLLHGWVSIPFTQRIGSIHAKACALYSTFISLILVIITKITQNHVHLQIRVI